MRFARLGLVFLLVAALTVTNAPGAEASPNSRAWLALGDSFSSGEGIPGTQPPEEGAPDCARATGEGTDATAWSAGAYREVKNEMGLSGLHFVACTGAINDDVEEQITEASRMEIPFRDSWDVVSFSFGGNNFGFAPIIMGCLDIKEPWQWGLLAPSPGCDTNQDEIKRRIDVLAGRVPFTQRGLEGKLTWPSLYDRVAKVVDPGGDVLVVGYPNLLEDPEMLPPWRKLVRTCAGILSTATAVEGVLLPVSGEGW